MLRMGSTDLIALLNGLLDREREIEDCLRERMGAAYPEGPTGSPDPRTLYSHLASVYERQTGEVSPPVADGSNMALSEAIEALRAAFPELN